MRFRRGGFTLVELMLVVSIIAILCAIAIPKYIRYQCKAKQIEARQGLGTLAKLQEAYYAEYSEYTMDLDEISFEMREITGPGRYYEYEMLSASDEEWEAMAEGIPEKFQNRQDTWTMDQNLTLTNVTNACL